MSNNDSAPRSDDESPTTSDADETTPFGPPAVQELSEDDDTNSPSDDTDEATTHDDSESGEPDTDDGTSLLRRILRFIITKTIVLIVFLALAHFAYQILLAVWGSL